MAVDGKVIIEALLDTKKAQKSAKGLGSHLKSGLAKGTKIAAAGLAAAGAAATATAGAVVKATKATMEYGVEVNRNSQKLNISRKGYQEWGYVLKRSGTSIDTLKMGMKKLSTSIDDAKKGTKSATDNFKRLGISVQDLQGKNQEEVFNMMIKKLQGVKDTTERSAIANKFFGRSAQELNGVLNRSGKEVDDLKKQANDLGLVLSDKAIKATADFRGSLTVLQSSFEGLRNKMAVQFLPALTKVTDGLSLLMQGKEKEGLKKIEQGIEEFTNRLNELTPKLFKLGGTILKSLGKGIINNLPTLLDAGASIILGLAKGIARAVPVIIKELPGIARRIGKELTGAIFSLLDNLEKTTPKKFQPLIRALRNIANTLIPAIKKAFQVLARVIEFAVDIFVEVVDVFTDSSIIGKTLRTVMLGVALAYGAYTAAIKAATLAELAHKAVSIAETIALVAMIAAEEGATAGFLALTAAMNVNPIVLAMTALIALGAAMAYLASQQETVQTQADKDIEAANKAYKAYDEYTKKLKENAKAREEAYKNAENEGTKIDYLYNKLKDLMKVEHKSTAQKKEIKSIVKQLNELVPNLGLKYDDEKDKLNKSTKAIKKNIEARKQKILADALEKNAKSIAEDIAKGEEKKNEIIKAGTKLQKDRADQEAIIAEARRKQRETDSAAEWSLQEAIAQTAQQEINKIDASIKKNDERKKKAEKNIDDLNKKYDETFTRMSNVEKKNVFDKLVKDAKKAGIEVPEALKSGYETGQISLEQAKKKLQNAAKIKDLNKNAKGEAKKTVDTIVDQYLNGQISAKEASKQLRDAGLKGLEGGKKKAKEHGKENPEGYKEGATSNKKGVEKAAKEGTTDQAKKGMSGGKKQATSSGKNVLQGFLDGLQNDGLLGGILNASKNLVDLVLGTIRKIGGEGSPWSTTTDSGEFAVEGLIKGAKNKQNDLKKAYADVAHTAVNSLDKQLLADSKYSTGYLQSQVNTAIDVSAGLRGLPDAVKEGFEDANVAIVVDDRVAARFVKGVMTQ